MTSQYYIVTPDGQKAGPYDLISMVKKIRNNAITTDTLVSTEEHPEALKASECPELAEFLAEQTPQEIIPQEVINKVAALSLVARLKSGSNFLKHNQLSTIFSGLYVLVFILLLAGVNLALPRVLHMLGYAVSLILLQFFFTGYIYSVLRMVRGQPVDFDYIKGKMSPIKKPLLITSLTMGAIVNIGYLFLLSGNVVSSTIGLIIVTLPGYYAMSLFIFSPLLILDKGIDFWDAISLSRKHVQKMGLENIGIIFSLLIINFLASMLFIAPIVTLPITISALCEMYDEQFS